MPNKYYKSMDKVHTIGIYKVLRILSSTSRQHVFKVKLNNQIFRLTAVPLLLSAQLTLSQTERVYQLLQKCSKYKELNHPNLETITDIFHHQEGPDHFLAIVGQYATEGDLEDFIQDDNTNKLAEMKAIMIDLCSAVQYLQNHSIIHCNITPQNIRKVVGKYKITFPYFKEIAWFNRRNKKTPPRQDMSFNQYYTSPELHSQAHFSQSIDVWSMGIIFYELISGKQFRLLSPQAKLPCQMGKFTDQMLSDVPNYMLRSLLKEMLTLEEGNRIGIGRVRNILTNTDISIVDEQLEEEIVDTTKYHEISLPIFAVGSSSERQSDDRLEIQNEMDYMQFSLDNFKIVVVCKHGDNSLQVCIYNSTTDLSIMTQYSYHQLPATFSQLFKDVSEIFKELNRETLRIANINVCGEIIFSLEENRYMQLKEARKGVPKDRFDSFAEPSTQDSLKFNTNTSDQTLWYPETDEANEDEALMYVKPEQDYLEAAEQQKLQKALQGRLRLKDEISAFDTYIIGSKLSKAYFAQQEYGLCMQHCEKMYNYFSTFLYCPYLAQFISKLIACNEILNDEEQVLKWRIILTQNFPDSVLPAYIYALVSLQDVNYLYLKHRMIKQRIPIREKLKFYYDEATEKLERLTTNKIDDNMGDRLYIAIQRILKRPTPRMHKILFLLLTKLNLYAKETDRYGITSFSESIVKVLIIYSSIAAKYDHKLYNLMQEWVRQNMPQNFTKVFDKKNVEKLLHKVLK